MIKGEQFRGEAAASARRVKRGFRACAGFSLLELILVVAVIAFLASATTLLNMGAKSQRNAMDQAAQMRRNIGHLQVLALSWGVPLRLTTASDGASYSVTCQGVVAATPCNTVAGAIPIDPATGDSFSVVFTNDVLISPVGTSVDFDTLGRPVASGALVDVDPVQTYSFTVSSTGFASVFVHPVTGFAELTFP